MNFKLLFIFFLLTCTAFSQNKGTITGTITDKELNNEALPFANVAIKGTSTGTNTDETGKYTLRVDPGEYTIEYSFVGYETIEHKIVITAGETIVVDKTLGSGAYTLDDVVIQTVARRNTETAILMEIREAKQVVSAISAEQMSKSTDGNAAEAIQRVPGITIVEGRFVMVRGLSERYNNVMLNGSIAPSTEADQRTFAFDLIPTGSLDRMVIYKTGSADKPGDFAGGMISVTTAESTNDFTSVSTVFGYRPGTTFEKYEQSEGSNTDWLGFDNNFRPLPSNFNGNAGVISAATANQLPNNFNPTSSEAYLDNGIGFSIGRKINLGGNNNRLYTINSLSRSNTFLSFTRDFTRYTTLNAGEDRPPVWFDYNDEEYQNEVSTTLMSNWIFRTGENTKIKFKNLFNQNGINETVIRRGFNYLQRGDDDLTNYFLVYKSRSIYTGQLEGEHKIGSKNRLDWVFGYNNISDKLPDFRRFRTFRSSDAAPGDPFIMIDPPSSNLFDTGRFYGELAETNINHGANFTHTIERLKDGLDKGELVLKAGYYGSYRDRSYDARYFSYLLPGSLSFERAEELRRLPLSEVFSSQNVNDEDGWSMREGTGPSDSYAGTNTYMAGYAQAEIPLFKFDLTVGLRVEHNNQTLESATALEAVDVDNSVTSFLPSLNVAYNLNENSLIRAAYSRTVNRPEFRELAPFVFYDFKKDLVRSGNPDLETATIDNIDVRYEIYPRKGETISFGAFYKMFDKPIENVTQVVTENLQFNYDNAEKAENYGVELELKKSLRGMTGSAIIDRITANVNASYIFSEVTLKSDVVSQTRNRPLQGQSPYIINAALGYEDEKDFSANIVYNRFGDRIFSVGDNNFPTLYELSRDNIDLTLSKKVRKTTFKLGIQNLLDTKFQLYEDSNRDEKINKSDDNPTSVYQRGSLITLGISYLF